MYLQLQKNDVAAGLLAATCDDGSATAPNLTPACQPSLPAQRYTTVANRDSIGGVDGSLFGGPAGSVVNLARRVPTSGTQSASNIRFLDKPCATGASQGALEPARATDSTGTAVVTEQSSTGGVKTALNAATGANQFALGVMSDGKHPGADRYSGPLGICQAGSGISQLRRAAARRGDGWLLQLLV